MAIIFERSPSTKESLMSNTSLSLQILSVCLHSILEPQQGSFPHNVTLQPFLTMLTRHPGVIEAAISEAHGAKWRDQRHQVHRWIGRFVKTYLNASSVGRRKAVPGDPILSYTELAPI